jgi:hypothetical protein
MLASGNGTAQQCAFNLLSLVQGECAYDRCRGLAAELTDRPTMSVMGEVVSEACWVLKYYEPRVQTEDINLAIEEIMEARYRLAAALEVGEG